MSLPAVLVFDVNETLSDLGGIRDAFEAAGRPAVVADLWFAGVLRDGFALQIVGATTGFADVARAGLDRFAPDAVDSIMIAFTELSVHPDVAIGLPTLAASGVRLVTMSNGAASVAETLLTNAGLREHVEHVLSVEEAGGWKPAAAAYHYASGRCGVLPAEAMLVAVHPWDIDGAARAGLRTAWIARDDRSYPRVFSPPELTATGLDDLADQLSRMERS